jgi:hypothetical protein
MLTAVAPPTIIPGRGLPRRTRLMDVAQQRGYLCHAWQWE